MVCSLSLFLLPSVDDAVSGELSKLLNEIKICRDKDCSFEELCQTISSHSHSMESFGSGRLSDEERNGTLTRINKVCIKKQIQYRKCCFCWLWTVFMQLKQCYIRLFPFKMSKKNSVLQENEMNDIRRLVSRDPNELWVMMSISLLIQYLTMTSRGTAELNCVHCRVSLQLI